MVRFIIFAALVAVAVTIYTLIDCARTDRHQVRSLPKAAWLVVILLLPLIGAGLWYVLGRPGVFSAPAAAPRSNAPDDDEDFLRQLDVWPTQQQREAELNQREADLKRKEAESGEDHTDPEDHNHNGSAGHPSSKDT